MKRRHFLASLAAASLFAKESWASKKKSTDSKPAASTNKSKSSKKAEAETSKRGTGRNSRNERRANLNSSTSRQPVAHSPSDSIVESPPQGSSATRLPPVRAVEPPADWRTFEITTTIKQTGVSSRRLWIPLPFSQDMLYQRTLSHQWQGNAQSAGISRLPDGALEVLQAEWSSLEDQQFTLKTTVTTSDRVFDITKRTIAPEREDILRRNLQTSRLIPNDGLAHQLGERILGRVKDPVAQGKAIFDWVVDNSTYDPGLSGCGTGDVRKQLTTGNYGGRSADINGLFVSLCRAVGIPARCVYGLRLGPSRLFRTLGVNNGEASSAQHVRAEFYVPGYGWIPVDPSDTRRAMALEGLSDRDSRWLALRKVLFGVWEMNWVAFNVGSDISLPGRQRSQPFLLYPQQEIGASTEYRPDANVPASFPYSIKTKQVEI